MIYRDIMKIMPENNRADYYSPEQMDCEYKKDLTNYSQCVTMGFKVEN